MFCTCSSLFSIGVYNHKSVTTTHPLTSGYSSANVLDLPSLASCFLFASALNRPGLDGDTRSFSLVNNLFSRILVIFLWGSCSSGLSQSLY